MKRPHAARPRRRDDRMRRRDFITLLGGAAAWPLAARAQQPERMRRIGVLMAYAENDREYQSHLAAFREELQKLGWTEGRNVQSVILAFCPAILDRGVLPFDVASYAALT